jgi:hypothetical protein
MWYFFRLFPCIETFSHTKCWLGVNPWALNRRKCYDWSSCATPWHPPPPSWIEIRAVSPCCRWQPTNRTSETRSPVPPNRSRPLPCRWCTFRYFRHVMLSTFTSRDCLPSFTPTAWHGARGGGGEVFNFQFCNSMRQREAPRWATLRTYVRIILYWANAGSVQFCSALGLSLHWCSF